MAGNLHGADPEAADFALGQGAAVRVVGLDVTHSCLFTGAQLAALAGRGRFGSFLAAITGFYLQYHRRTPSTSWEHLSALQCCVQTCGDKASGSGRFVSMTAVLSRAALVLEVQFRRKVCMFDVAGARVIINILRLSAALLLLLQISHSVLFWLTGSRTTWTLCMSTTPARSQLCSGPTSLSGSQAR